MSAPQLLPLKRHGIVMDLDPEDVVASKWTSGRNVRFRNGETWRVPGMGRFAEAGRLFAAEFCFWVDIGFSEWWIYGSGEGIGATNGDDHYDITPDLWGPITTANGVFTYGDMNMLPFMNHPQYGPSWWDGDPTHNFEPLPDWPAGWTCGAMRAHKNYLIAMAIDTGSGLAEGQVSWSSSADPGAVPEFWIPAPDNDAGDMTFASPSGPILDGISVRDQLFVMKANATFAMQYVGGQWIFQGRDVFPSSGILATGTCLEDGNMVYLVTGAGEIVRHDGNSIQNLLYGVLQDYFNRSLNYQYPGSIFLYRDPLPGQLGIAYPTGDSKACTEAIEIELASIGREPGVDAGIRDLPGVYGWGSGYTAVVSNAWDDDPDTWDSDSTQWNEQATGYRPPHLVFAGGEAGMLDVGLSDDMDGVPITAFAERTGMDFEAPQFHKVVSGAFPRVTGEVGSTLNYRFGSAEAVRDPVSWLPEKPFAIAVDTQLDFFVDGRFLAMSVSSNGGGVWKLNGTPLLLRKAGKW